MDNIGIEFISVLGMPPAEFVGVAADLGCRHIGIALQPIVSQPGAFPAWSLRSDAGLRRELAAALADRGVSISIGEGYMVRPGADIRDAAADLDLMCEMGIGRVNVLGIDPDRARTFDQLAIFAEMVGERQIEATLEFMPGPPLQGLAGAVEAVRHVGRPDFKLLIDTMHLFRSGSTIADVAALDPALIGYVQLCDVPLVSRGASYGDEARFDRLEPGKGELPLRDFLAALPPGLIVGLEVPMLATAEAGIGARERLAGSVAAAREMMESAGCL